MHSSRSRSRRSARFWAGVVTAAALVAALIVASAAGAKAGHSTANTTLVVDNSFDLKSADPAHSGEPTGELVDRAIYDTLLTFNGANVATPIPDLASSYKASADARTYTFTLRKGIHFGDGTQLTSADVVFSLNRVINIKGVSSTLLAGVTVTAKGPWTVILKSATPNPAIPAIITNAALGITEAKVVKAHGGTSAPGADQSDKAESFLNSQSAGTGPYMLKSFDVASQVVLSRNPHYWGPPPAFQTVVIRNVAAPTQLLDVQRGTNEIALDLSPTQASTINSKSVLVHESPSANVIFLFANRNPQVSATASNADFAAAVRYALDYPGLVKLAGKGAVQAGGIVPSMFLGSLGAKQSIKTNVAKAKAELAASGLSNPTVKLEFPSDITLNGVAFATIAQRIQSELGAVGISVTLAGSPIATALTGYRAGQEEMGLWYWSPDYPDPNDYVAFLPGQLVGLRVGWTAGADATIDQLSHTASTSPDPATRAKAFQSLQERMNSIGPFFPLIQPGQVIVASKNLTNTVYNPVWYLNIAGVGTR